MQLRNEQVCWRDLSWRVVETVEEILTPWQGLAARAADQPFQHPAWISAWLSTRGRALSIRPRIVVGQHHGRAEMVVPLGIAGRGALSVLRWLGADASDYNAPLASPELRAGFAPADAAAFWRLVIDRAGPAAVLDLANQPERIGGEGNPFIARPTGEEACRSHSRRLPPAAAQSCASKRHRKRLRALERDVGKAAFVTWSAGQACAAAVERIVGWKRAQLAESGGFSPFEAHGMQAFLASAAGDPAMPIRVAMLWTGTVPIAGFILIDADKADFIYQCAYDPAFASCSPGTILRQLVELDAVSRGKTVLDFGPGDEAYKAEICDRSMRLLRTIKAVQPSGAALAMMLRARLAMKRRIKSTPAVYGSICSAHRIGMSLKGWLRSWSGLRRNPETLETA